jgi:putative CRISPR-associated protein (TIGR02619 family)
MTRVILNTVGTSLLGNAKRANLQTDDELLEFLQRDPRKASAETNALDRLLEPDDRAVMLYSDTPDGERCARLIARYLERTHPAETERVPGLSYHERGFAQHGLRNLVHALAGRIRTAQRNGHAVLINATGGFKAEIAYATALGLVFKVPVCYIHEAFGDIITLPATPFGWDHSLILECEAFFEWVDDQPRTTDKVRWRVQHLPDTVPMLLEDTPDGFTVLSALGQTYLEAFKSELEQSAGVPVLLSVQARRDWETFDPVTRAAFSKLLGRLRLENRHVRSELKSGGGDALGFPKGNVNERLFYAERDGSLYVFEFVRHGPKYEALCARGLRWHDYPRETFTQLEP